MAFSSMYLLFASVFSHFTSCVCVDLALSAKVIPRWHDTFETCRSISWFAASSVRQALDCVSNCPLYPHSTNIVH